jgi:DNA-binding IclR family transcriptional regulator
MVAFAVPIKTNRRDVQAAIWAAGLAHQVSASSIQEQELAQLLKGISEEIGYRLQ